MHATAICNKISVLQNAYIDIRIALSALNIDYIYYEIYVKKYYIILGLRQNYIMILKALQPQRVVQIVLEFPIFPSLQKISEMAL